MEFTKDYQPAKAKAGRPKGSRNKRAVISDELHKEALAQLEIAVKNYEPWAVESVLARTMPKLKPITPTDSLDGKMLEARIAEITEIKTEIEEIKSMLKVLSS